MKLAKKVLEQVTPKTYAEDIELMDERKGWDRPNFKSLKDASKRFPKIANAFSKDWDKYWNEQRDAVSSWEGLHWEMKYALLDLRIALEDDDAMDSVPDDLYNDIQGLQDTLDQMAKYQQLGSVAPLGAVKRMLKSQNIMDRLQRVSDFTKTLK